MRELPLGQDEHLRRDPRAAELRLLPDGTTRLSRDGDELRHLPLDEINTGFDLMHAQDGIRSVLTLAWLSGDKAVPVRGRDSWIVSSETDSSPRFRAASVHPFPSGG